MRAIDALELILTDGLDNSMVQLRTDWGLSCRITDRDNVEYAEVFFGTKSVVEEVYRYTPVESVLIVWRNKDGDDTDFRKHEEPILVVSDEFGTAEIYALD